MLDVLKLGFEKLCHFVYTDLLTNNATLRLFLDENISRREDIINILSDNN